MADPLIVNLTPSEGDTDVGADEPIRFGLRDADTRVDLGTVYTGILYARSMFEAVDEDLPTEVEGLSAVLSVFDDVAGATEPVNPADQSFSGGLYQIERTGDNDAEEAFIYLAEVIDRSRPVAVSAALLPTVTSTPDAGYDPFSYVPFGDWTGMLLGLIYWPLNKGIFLFFRDDTASGGLNGKYLTIAGPAEDAAGNRPAVQVDLPTFDWGADTYTYQVLWDDTPSHRRVVVLAVSSDGTTQTLLADIAVMDIPEFRGSFQLGRHGAGEDVAALVVGNDGRNAGDRLDIEHLYLYAFGKSVLVGGVNAAGVDLAIQSNDSTLLVDSADGWVEVGDGSLSTEGITLTREEDAAAAAFYLSRSEPDLARQEWMVLLFGTATDSTHLGSYNSGLGIDVQDGTNRFSVRLLDDFADTVEVGILVDATKSGLLEGYDTATLDWQSSAFAVALLGSQSQNFVRLFTGDDEASAVSMTYSSPIASALSEVGIGFLDGDLVYTGALEISSAWLFTNVRFYEAENATLPVAQGWTVASSGVVAVVVDGRLDVPGDIAGAYYVIYVGDADYDATSGATLAMKAEVSAWTDAAGAVSPSGAFGPIGAIVVPGSSPEAVQIFFYRTAAGETYVCLPHSEEDFEDISQQTEAGQAISSLITLDDAHVFILVVKPNAHVRLYVDYSPTPVIDVEWGQLSTVTMDLPTNLPVTDGGGDPVVGAWGSLGENRGVAVEIPFARISVGTGYDISAALRLDEDELTDHVYGSQVSVFIDFSDQDP